MQVQLPEGQSLQEFAARLPAGCTLQTGRPYTEDLALYDTFDWRLFRRSLVLTWNGRELILRSLPAGEIIASAPASGVPGFARQVDAGPLRQILEQSAGIRTLLCIGKIHSRSTPCQVLNAEGKIVVRLIWSLSRVDKTAPARVDVFLQRVRGYDGRFNELAQSLSESGTEPGAWQQLYTQAVQASGSQPGSYTSRPVYQLDPQMRSDDAVKIGLRHWLGIIRANEAGIRADLDTEFLHEFRTAIRRTRSALSQLSGVFPEQVTLHYKTAFGQIAQGTNRLRDLDVYLLAEPEYRLMLPAAMRENLTPVFDHLRGQRQQAADAVAALLVSETYTHTMQDWEVFLNQPAQPDPQPLNAVIPVLALAQRRIDRCYRRVIINGRLILDNAQDALLHELRIDCKKLRYLIEFFASLFPPEQYDAAIVHMKTLQDMLGQFCDLSIQQSSLLALAEELPLENQATRKALLATGFLIDNLDREQQAARSQFASAFNQFMSPASRRLFSQLTARNLRKEQHDDHRPVQQQRRGR